MVMMLEEKVDTMVGSTLQESAPVVSRRPKMRVVVTSDLHGYQPYVPEADLFILCGDLTRHGTITELVSLDKWFARIEKQFRYGILYIAGNHDWLFYRNGLQASSIMQHGRYLEDEGVTINGWKFYGSPWTPQFYNWAFMDDDANLIEVWRRARDENPDVLITHGPPSGILDHTDDGYNAGSQTLHIVQPKYHFFGHIHEAYGQVRVGKTLYVNAAHCDSSYNPVNSPVIVDLE